MGEQRERAGRTRDEAWAAVVAGWPQRRWDPADYERVYALLAGYYQTRFPQLDLVTCRGVVTAAVGTFMADWYAGLPARVRGGNGGAFPSAREVSDAVADAVLERHGLCDGSAGADLLGPNVHDDESLAALALRAKPDAVRAGLRELFAEGARDDFLVISQYLDMADAALGRPPPTAAVVARLQGAVGELAAREAIVAFQARLKRIARHDAVV